MSDRLEKIKARRSKAYDPKMGYIFAERPLWTDIDYLLSLLDRPVSGESREAWTQAIAVVQGFADANQRNIEDASTDFQIGMWGHKLDTCRQILDHLKQAADAARPVVSEEARRTAECLVRDSGLMLVGKRRQRLEDQIAAALASRGDAARLAERSRIREAVEDLKHASEHADSRWNLAIYHALAAIDGQPVEGGESERISTC